MFVSQVTYQEVVNKLIEAEKETEYQKGRVGTLEVINNNQTKMFLEALEKKNDQIIENNREINQLKLEAEKLRRESIMHSFSFKGAPTPEPTELEKLEAERDEIMAEIEAAEKKPAVIRADFVARRDSMDHLNIKLQKINEKIDQARALKNVGAPLGNN